MRTTARHEDGCLALLRDVWEHGDERRDRTGVGTRALFGPALRFDLSGDALPLLTTKRVAWKTAARELLWQRSCDLGLGFPSFGNVVSSWSGCFTRREIAVA